jgi:hypothetical protein
LIDPNFLTTIKFKLTLNALPEVVYYAQRAYLPGIRLGSVDVTNPNITMAVGGDHLTIEPFRINFILDSQMNNYYAIAKWMMGIGEPYTPDQYKAQLTKGIYSDGSLFIYDSKNNPLKKVIFTDMFPISLTGIQFMNDANDVNYAKAQATFKFLTMNVDNIGSIDENII